MTKKNKRVGHVEVRQLAQRVYDGEEYTWTWRIIRKHNTALVSRHAYKTKRIARRMGKQYRRADAAGWSRR